jgi:hypothetical protein
MSTQSPCPPCPPWWKTVGVERMAVAHTAHGWEMDSPDAYEGWLRGRARARGLSRLAAAPVVVALGAAATWLTRQVFFFAMTAAAVNAGADVSEQTIRVVATAIVVLVFIEYVRRSSQGIVEYSFEPEPGAGRSFLLRPPSRGAFGLLYPGRARNAVTFVFGFLFIAPWLVVSGVRLIGEGLRLLTLDVRGCAAVIALLHARGRKVPYKEIAADLPQLNFQRVFRHLHALGGVLFLWEEPPGLALSGDTDGELTGKVR